MSTRLNLESALLIRAERLRILCAGKLRGGGKACTVQVFPDYLAALSAFVVKITFRGSSAERLDSQRAVSGKQIQNGGGINFLLDHAEHGLFHPAERRACKAGIQSLQFQTAGRAGYDPWTI